MREKQKVYRVVLMSKFGVSRSVFIEAKNREAAERKALRRHPHTRIDHSPFPQN
jgi:hypothetical protein